MTEPDPNPRPRSRWAGPVVIAALSLAVVALIVRPAIDTPTAVPVPAARIVPAAVAPTMPAKPAPVPYVVRVTPKSGAFCILPGGRTIGPVTLAEVP